MSESVGGAPPQKRGNTGHTESPQIRKRRPSIYLPNSKHRGSYRTRSEPVNTWLEDRKSESRFSPSGNIIPTRAWRKFVTRSLRLSEFASGNLGVRTPRCQILNRSHPSSLGHAAFIERVEEVERQRPKLLTGQDFDQATVARTWDIDDLIHNHPAWLSCHHDDPIRQQNRLL